MRSIARWPFQLLAWLALAVPSAAECFSSSEDGRNRPGNDDLFIFVDTSLSMAPATFGPYAHGMMEPVKEVLLKLVDCYVKPGDRVLIATFDSEARIRSAQEIHGERDLSLLREVITALEPGRARYWRRLPSGRTGDEVAHGERSSHVTGGSLHTDLGAMFELSRRVLHEYNSPDHRQLLLVFTDGEHEPPEGSRYPPGQFDLGQLLPDPSTARHKLGVALLPTVAGTVNQHLIDMVRRVDPMQQAARAFPTGEGAAKAVSELLDLLSLTVDLKPTERILLAPQVRPYVERTFHIINRTQLPREVQVRQVQYLQTGRPPKLLRHKPSTLTLAPGESAEIYVSGSLGEIQPGEFKGELRFEFAGPAAVYPPTVEVSGHRLRWLERYGAWAAAGAFLLTGAGLLGLALWRKPVWVVLKWQDEGRLPQLSTPRALAIRQTLKFGALGTGGLEVEGPESRIGEVERTARQRYCLRFDPLYLNVAGDPTAGQPRSLTPGIVYPVPGTDHQAVSFLVCYRRKRALAVSRALGGGSGSGETSQVSTEPAPSPFSF